jgi:hypothetical protein
MACATQGAERIGPIEIDVPAGWQASRQSRTNLKITDGTLGSQDDTEPGTATAVFDVYVNSRHTPQSYRELVAAEGGTVLEEDVVRVGAQDATVLDVEGESFAGKWTVVLIARGGILIVYRAAFPHDDEAFRGGRPALLEAVRSIRFVRSG